MLNFSYLDKPDVSAYARDIKAEGATIYVDRELVTSISEEYSALVSAAYACLNTALCTASHGSYRVFSKEAMISTLITYCGCQHVDFVVRLAEYRKYRSEQGIEPMPNPFWSVSMPAIIEPLANRFRARLDSGACSFQNENAYELLQAYIIYKRLSTRANTIASKLSKVISQPCIPGWSKNISKVDFKYTQKSTGRFYTEQDSIQNWPLEMTRAICADRDYFLFWCDFDQIDFRVGYHIYLREPGSPEDEIYLRETDKYKAMYTIICKSANKQPDYELFTKYRKAYKKAILSAMYNASEQALINDIKNQELAHELYEFFKHNKKYQTYVRHIEDNIHYGVDLVTRDYFGAMRDIPMPNCSKDQEYQSAVAAACNTPIQSTSNSIVELWLEGLLEKFEEHGYSRTEHVIPYLIRHDECIFKIHKSVLKDLWIFKDCMSVAIDDWDILTLEPHLGIYYKTPDERLEEIYDVACLQNASRFTDRTINDKRAITYRPITEVLQVYTYTLNPIQDITAVAYTRHKEELITMGFSSEPNAQWTEQQCLEVLEKCSFDDSISQFLKCYNKFFIYSEKLNKYRAYNSMAEICKIAESIGTNKISCHTVNTVCSKYHNEIMLKIDEESQDILNKLLTRAINGDNIGEWFTI